MTEPNIVGITTIKLEPNAIETLIRDYIQKKSGKSVACVEFKLVEKVSSGRSDYDCTRYKVFGGATVTMEEEAL